VMTARESAWMHAFNRGIALYNEGDMEGAARQWEQANLIYGRRSEAHLNLAAIATQAGDFERAITAYTAAIEALDPALDTQLPEEEIEGRAQMRREIQMNLGQLLTHTEQFERAERVFRSFLAENPGNVEAQTHLAVALARLGRQDEALATYEALIRSPDASASDLFNVGVGLFQIERYGDAAAAFRRVTEISPHNRDAWYNYLNALYAQRQFTELVPVADRLLELDPLNEDALLIQATAYRETRRNERALEVLQRRQQLPITLDGLQFRPSAQGATLEGVVTGNAAREGTPVRSEFTFFGPDGAVGTRTVTVAAPRAEATTPLRVDFEGPTPVIGYRYSVAG
jgi:tetratricopeptide (TPR) repeat protein